MAELEANIAKIPDAEVNMSSKDLMSNITKVKLQLMLFAQNDLSLTVSAAEKIASKFRLEEQRKLRRLFVEAAYDPTKMMDTITALADMVYQAEAAQAIFETRTQAIKERKQDSPRDQTGSHNSSGSLPTDSPLTKKECLWCGTKDSHNTWNCKMIPRNASEEALKKKKVCIKCLNPSKKGTNAM